jgi:hypothetical protein
MRFSHIINKVIFIQENTFQLLYGHLSIYYKEVSVTLSKNIRRFLKKKGEPIIKKKIKGQMSMM